MNCCSKKKKSLITAFSFFVVINSFDTRINKINTLHTHRGVFRYFNNTHYSWNFKYYL